MMRYETTRMLVEAYEYAVPGLILDVVSMESKRAEHLRDLFCLMHDVEANGNEVSVGDAGGIVRFLPYTDDKLKGAYHGV